MKFKKPDLRRFDLVCLVNSRGALHSVIEAFEN